MEDGMDELLAEFLVESFENLDQLDQDLVVLEQAPNDLEVLKSIFRTIHTIKGTCGFLGLSKLERITHVGESLLSLLRDEVATVDAEIATALLAMTDAVRAILVEIEKTHAEGDVDYSALVDTLERLETRAKGEPEADAAAVEPVEAAETVEIPEVAEHDRLLGEILVATGEVREVDVAVGLINQEHGDDRPLGEILVDAGVADTRLVADALAEQREAKSSVADSTLRVDVALLDQVMTLVGELVLARNQILQYASTQDVEPAFANTTQRLNMITTELQAGVMKTRMQPIGSIWSRFPRVVRDLAAQFGKQVRIEMEGKETELDKTIIEAIKDPLTHIVRNSIDHGIETPETRRAAGKPEEGVLFLRAYHEGGQVIIEILDDGAGIDLERVKAKATARGFITSEQAAKMSDREAANLVFLPGLSTAEKVSNVSGRGVGMDVVRTNIEKIGGTLDMQTRPGAGTTIKVKIPLTLAIVPALIVSSGGDRYAIPQVSLLELVGLDRDSARVGIESVHGAPVYRLRGQILPIIYLDRELEVADGDDASNVTIVVLKADDRQFGMVVDQVHDTEEIVVKPLSPQLKSLSGFSGCTIMGDGHVALILDVLGLAQRAHVVSEVQEQQGVGDGTSHLADTREPTETLLILKVGHEGRAAVSLAAVDRLEEFKREDLERTAGRDVVQYRDTILPLVDIGASLGYAPTDEYTDTVQVVVYSNAGRMIGFVADRIVDIVEQVITIQQKSDQPGIVGSLVVQGAVTDLLDIEEIVRSVAPFYETLEEVVTSV
ncbi:MAG: two-component system, chemotaxis family, sensor kinase CheA [Actinomycetia bacterium]|nr:two-component system, chemotaxis family, sensor kinase CheA [Actinomycetes bacterium]